MFLVSPLLTSQHSPKHRITAQRKVFQLVGTSLVDAVKALTDAPTFTSAVLQKGYKPRKGQLRSYAWR